MVQVVVAEPNSGSAATVIHAAGELDVTSIDQLRDAIDGQFRAGRFRLVLDLAGLTFLDSRGLGVLVGLLRVARGQGGDLRPACVPPRIRRLFTITDLDDVFALDEDVCEARRALEADAPVPSRKG